VKPKHQRLSLAVLAIIAVAAAVLLAMWGLRDRAAYFFTPEEVAIGKAQQGAAIRLGGMVEKGTLKKTEGTLDVQFYVTDYKHTVEVKYSGILPDLFREGQGVVAHGRMQGNVFVADEILAKHDEKYMPPEVAKSLKDNPPPPNVGSGT